IVKAAGPVTQVAPSVSTLAEVIVVAGTDTDIGKTVVSAALLAAARDLHGERARYWKPVQTGDVSDTQEVLRLAGAAAQAAIDPVHTLPLPASPHEAAAAAGTRIDVAAIRTRLAQLRAQGGVLILELAGGLLVPYDDHTTQLDFLQAENLAP